MMKKFQQILMLLFLLLILSPANAQKPSAKTGTIRNVVAVSTTDPSYFTIQVLALKERSKDVAFFKAFKAAEEFFCADGYYRYVTGKYNSKEEAQAALANIRALGIRYEKAYVVNTANFTLNASVKKPVENAKNATDRTNKKIVLADKITEPFFAIQILAMKVAPQDPKFFDNVDEAREFACKDGWTRWTVGRYASKEEANADLSKTRALSPKYKASFVVNTSNYQLATSAFNQEAVGTRTNKKIVPTDKLPKTPFTIQVIALKAAPQDALFFDKLEQALEVSCTDGYKRYLVGEYNSKEEAASDLNKIKNLGPKYKNAFIVGTANIKIDLNAYASTFVGDKVDKAPSRDVAGKVYERLTIVSQTTDTIKETPNKKESGSTGSKSMRTNKKIIPVEKATEPYYTVQLLAIKDAPQDANFFDNIENAREFSCKDGYKRYTVGQFKTAEEAAEMVAKMRALSPKYEKAFVANTSKYEIEKSAFQSDFVNNESSSSDEKANTSGKAKTSTTSTTGTTGTTATTPTTSAKTGTTATTSVNGSTTPTTTAKTATSATTTANASSTPTTSAKASTSKNTKGADATNASNEETAATQSNTAKDKPSEDINIDPDKIYTIQVTASRYPFYTSELNGLKDVYEFFMPDKVYRYTVGKLRGSAVKAELNRVMGFGYKEAFIVEWDKYAAYLIE